MLAVVLPCVSANRPCSCNAARTLPHIPQRLKLAFALHTYCLVRYTSLVQVLAVESTEHNRQGSAGNHQLPRVQVRLVPHQGVQVPHHAAGHAGEVGNHVCIQLGQRVLQQQQRHESA